jgi:hypothetical protein
MNGSLDIWIGGKTGETGRMGRILELAVSEEAEAESAVLKLETGEVDSRMGIVHSRVKACG